MTKEVKKVVIIPHVNPDGDAIGSAIGLNSILNNAGFESVVIVLNDFPSYLSWLGSDGVPLIYEQSAGLCHEMIDQADAFFFLDFNDVKRLGKLEEYLGKNTKPVVLIDHHPDPAITTEYLFSDINVSSTAELVFDFVDAL